MQTGHFIALGLLPLSLLLEHVLTQAPPEEFRFTRLLCGFSLDPFEFLYAVLHVDNHRVSRKLTSDGLLSVSQLANNDGWRGLSSLASRGSEPLQQHGQEALPLRIFRAFCSLIGNEVEEQAEHTF